MNYIVRNIVLRFLILLIIQVGILKRIQVGPDGFNYFSVFIYPLFLILIPMRINDVLYMGIGLATGLIYDFFYDSPGVHAAACVALCYFRHKIVLFIEPKDKYRVNLGLTPANYGYSWFFKYAGALLFIHLLFYYSFTLFSPVYFGEILLRTILTFIFSMVIIGAYMVVFRPKD